jgi:dihydroorotate dehydrogenase (fumarate)
MATSKMIQPILKPLSLVMNASGCHCRIKTHLDNLVDAGMTTIITKTCTLLQNKGNPEPCFQEINENISINCLGMPNQGYFYYRDLFLEYTNKRITYIISMDASSQEDLQTMLLNYNEFLSQLKAQNKLAIDSQEYVEINLSCPSTKCSRIISYDILAFARLLETIKSLELTNIVIGLKLSPYIDKVLLSQVGNLIIKYQSTARIAYIVCSNSIPNGMILDTSTGQPKLSGKTGGISGTVNKLLGVSNTWQFYELFQSAKMQSAIKIIGCGGIETNNDILEYLHAGAKGVQIGRILYLHSTEILNNLNPNLNYLISKL